MGKQLIGKQVLSIHAGGPIGTIISPIVNPNNLKIEGWFIEDIAGKQRLIVLSQDIRDTIEQGFVVNDHEAMTQPGELVRLQPVLELNFELIGKAVITENKHRIGKVSDYAFEKDTAFIQKIYVNQSIVKSFSGGSAIVDRSQITEINNKRIIVKEATVPSKVEKIQPAVSPVQPELA